MDNKSISSSYFQR